VLRGDAERLSSGHPHELSVYYAPGGSNMRRSKARFRGLMLCVMLALTACAAPGAAATGSASTAAVHATPTATPRPFDPSVGAPLPGNRIVAAYGISGGVDFNGPASELDMLDGFLPQLQDLGKQYATLDPTHPVLLGIDLVVNVIQPCGSFPKWCASFADDQTIQAYIDYCKKHNLLLFFDLQLGTEPVSDAVTTYLLPYLQKYTFTELALDTEFHFPNTPEGYADAEGYPCCLGWMNASEINWASNELAQISMQNHLPRKVLVIHEWNSGVLPDKEGIKLNPNVSVVLQSDGFGFVDNKLGDYQVFVQQQLIEYGGYKLFFQYPDNPDAAHDIPFQSPQDVLNIFPQPLFISYQ
jgi:hypothetical protein